MINRVVLMGRLVAEPELKTTQSGVSVTSFRIAVDKAYQKQGEERKADFFDIVAWRYTAEFICKHFRKGSMIAIDGQLQSRTYQAQDGSKRYVVEVVADNASFTGEKISTNQPQAQPQAPTFSEPTYSQPSLEEFEVISPDDDLPF